MTTVDIIITIVRTAAVFFLVFNLGGLMTFVERKQSALMQDRIGANRAFLPFIPDWKGIRVLRTFFGVWHNIADAIKMLTKENFQPRATDKFVYNLALWFAVVPTLMTAAVIPIMQPVQFGKILDIPLFQSLVPGLVEFMKSTFGDRVITMQVANLNVGLLYIFAITGLGIFGAVLAGWSSNNKFALLGGLRAAAQMISYEIPMGISLMGLILIFGTLSVTDIVRIQGETYFLQGYLPGWGIVVQPFAFFLFLTAAIAENKRIPFDIPEGESEIIAGYYTEYSAMKMGLFMLSEFVQIAIIAMIIATLFFGGYNVPWLHGSGFVFPWGVEVPLPHIVVTLITHLAFMLKVIFFCWFQILIRWTLPRFRYDQLMKLGWKILLPLSIVNLIITSIVMMFLDLAK